ncbi:unnamed protein product [Chironomus riparius]|uniref:Uncharacterized protein n=1 Tax=Chironomus riparius TaxID=315576 RepID=A0A9N9RKH9_9DIPT|nr:unnamed protein product [Chironomus riparius]
MNERFKKIIVLFVLACSYVEVVWSENYEFPSSISSLTQGTSFSLPSSYSWHANGDVYRPISTSNFPLHSYGINRNEDPSKKIHEEVKAILAEMNKVIKTDEHIQDKSLWNLPQEPETTKRSTSMTKITSSTTSRATTKRLTTRLPSKCTTPYHYEVYHHYGDTFGDNKLLDNTYIAKNNYFEDQPPLGPGPLAKALFSSGYKWGFTGYDDSNSGRNWDKNADKKWRATTKAPYFENKVPGEDKILPASSVSGAATAVGVVSLLPLIVPPYKPLMYCGNTELQQLPIRINEKDIYICNKNTFEISCPDNFMNQMNNICMNKKLQCDLKYNEVNGNIFCRNGTLYSKANIYCTSTTTIRGRIETMDILECREGQIPSHLGSFIPTTTPNSFFTTTTSKPKPLSFGAQAHLFILKLMGKFDVVKTETTTESYPSTKQFAWHPVPMSVPSEITTGYIPTVKDYSNTDSAKIFVETPTSSSLTATTEAPYEWMRIVFYQNNETKLEHLPQDLVEIAEHIHSSEIPTNWMKVFKSDRSRTTVPSSDTEKGNCN